MIGVKNKMTNERMMKSLRTATVGTGCRGWQARLARTVRTGLASSHPRQVGADRPGLGHATKRLLRSQNLSQRDRLYQVRVAGRPCPTGPGQSDRIQPNPTKKNNREIRQECEMENLRKSQ